MAKMFNCAQALCLIALLAGKAASLRVCCEVEYERVVHLELIDFCETIIELEMDLYAEQNEYNFSNVLRFIDEARKHDGYTVAHERSVIENPLAMYKLKRWLKSKWAPALDEMTNSIIIHQRPELLRLLKGYKEMIENLSINDIVKDIADLVYIYDLPVNAVAMGTFASAQTDPLDKEDIFQFIESLNDVGRHTAVLDWLQYGFCNSSVRQEHRLYYRGLLASTYLKLHRYQDAKLIFKEILKEDKTNRGAISNLRLIEERLQNDSTLGQPDKYSDYVKTIKQYCHGFLKVSEHKIRNLQCREARILNSTETVRVSELHNNPHIFMLHDVFAERRRRVLIEKASTKLTSLLGGRFAKHQATKQGTKVYFKGNWWMEPYVIRMRNITYRHPVDFEDHPEILNWVSVVNYGAGMRPRMIRTQKTELNTPFLEQQIAQYHIFLQVPERGGELVFPDLKLRIKPIEGAAVFWQFRTRNTPVHKRLIQRIYCPVLIGSQWNAKFILEHQDLVDWVTF